MSDYIERSEIYKLFDENGNGIERIHISQIDTLPAADVVEVVRCKDCKRNPDIGTQTKGMVWCRRFRKEVHPNGFCSYGEAKMDGGKDDA